MTTRVLGIDPGLTRCGIGIVDVAADRKATLVLYTVVRTPPSQELSMRLRTVGEEIERCLDRYAPAVVAVERVFAQSNLTTVMGTAQISGVALHAAARRDIPVSLHTPSEVKAAVTGHGAAGKEQVAAMVQRLLGLAEPPRPADAADALALAICCAWRSSGPALPGGASGPETPAQKAWRAAERAARSPGAAPRLSR